MESLVEIDLSTYYVVLLVCCVYCVCICTQVLLVGVYLWVVLFMCYVILKRAYGSMTPDGGFLVLFLYYMHRWPGCWSLPARLYLYSPLGQKTS